jgi:hypothetical protein
MKLRKALIPVAAAAGAALAEVYKYTFCRNGSRILNPMMDKRTHSADYYAHRDGAAQALREAPQLRFAMRSERGELLRGFYYPCGEKPCGVCGTCIDRAEAFRLNGVKDPALDR